MSFEKKAYHIGDECIICFDKHTDTNPLLSFNSINTIITQCNCDYKCHLKCLSSWLKQNSSCLMCNSSVISIPSILNLDVRSNFRSLSAPLLTANDNNSVVVQYSPPPPYDSLVSQYNTTEINSLTLSNDNQDDISIVRTGENIIVDVGSNIHSQIETDSDYDNKLNCISNTEILEVADSSSCKCCCIVLTLITIGIVIKSIF